MAFLVFVNNHILVNMAVISDEAKVNEVIFRKTFWIEFSNAGFFKSIRYPRLISSVNLINCYINLFFNAKMPKIFFLL